MFCQVNRKKKFGGHRYIRIRLIGYTLKKNCQARERKNLSKNKRETIYTFPVLVLIVTVGVSFLGLGLVMPLRALYGRQLGASSTEIGLMTTSFLLAGFLATPG